MAINISDKYPGRSNPPSIDYPQGSIKNQTAPGARDGTPLDEAWANDKEGFFQSLLSKAGVVANGLVDKVGASQYLDALTSGFRASNAELNAGVEDDKFVTPKKLRSGFSVLTTGGNGFIAFPTWLGGVVVQWGANLGGASGPATYSFPTQFPNYATVIVSTIVSARAANSSRSNIISASQFEVASVNSTATSYAPDPIFWIAIGS